MMEAGNVVQPDSITYASVIDCYSKSNLPDAGKKAEIILNRMIQRYDEDNRRARPTVYAFTSCIDCYAKSSDPESPLRAQNILNRMESSTYAKPNTITLTSLMEAWVNSNNKDSYAHAEKLLERMETSNRNLQPNVVSYTLYLKALRKCEDKNFAVSKAEEVLNKMIIASNNGKRNMRPNRATLNAAYAIFSQNSAKKARHKIEKFKEQIGRIKRS